MPMTVAVAPNGAMTKVITKSVSDEQLAMSFVTPAMAHCMKSMQQGRLVFICIQSKADVPIPSGVRDMMIDPLFKDRVEVVPVRTGDAAEAPLIQELESDVAVKGATTVFLAPPGVLVGKFGPAVTKEQLASALHKAGKCCEDENCKHNQSQPPADAAKSRSASKPVTGRKK